MGNRKRLTQKDRRNSGWFYPDSTLKCKKDYIIENCLEPSREWDDWNERRDGCRGYSDKTKLRPALYWFKKYWDVERWNRKIKKMLKVRVAKKNGRVVLFN